MERPTCGLPRFTRSYTRSRRSALRKIIDPFSLVQPGVMPADVAFRHLRPRRLFSIRALGRDHVACALRPSALPHRCRHGPRVHTTAGSTASPPRRGLPTQFSRDRDHGSSGEPRRAETRASDGRARKPAHDQTLRSNERATDAGRGGEVSHCCFWVSPSASVQAAGGQREHARSQEFDASSPVHRPFQRLQPIDVALGWTVAPTHRHGVSHRLEVCRSVRANRRMA